MAAISFSWYLKLNRWPVTLSNMADHGAVLTIPLNSISVNVHLSGLVGLVRPWWFLVMFSCTLVGCSAMFSQILYAYPAISSPGLASNVQHVPTIGNYGEL